MRIEQSEKEEGKVKMMITLMLTCVALAVSAGETSHLEERTSTTNSNQSKLPEIYLIGDSIRLGYCNDVARELAGKAVVCWPDCNCQNTQNVLVNLGYWRKFTTSPRVIQFNCGHWDASHWDGDADPITSLEEYRKNIRLIIRRLKRYYPSATLVFATTTPMNPSGAVGVNRRTTEQIRRYNSVGADVAREEGVLVNDLFSSVAGWKEEAYKDYCHFTPESNARLGMLVADYLWGLAVSEAK